MVKDRVLLFTFFIFFTFVSSAQTDLDEETRIAGFVENINKFSYLYPQEKVYLHFDNTGYYLGENIWFSAYITTADDLIPTTLSKVLYTELLTPEGYVIEMKKYKITEGRAYGDFYLPDSMFAGYYEVRAYTRSMLNFGEETIFSRVFPVYDRPKKPGDFKTNRMTVRNHEKRIPQKRTVLPKLNAVNIVFFPEGGNMIYETNTRVAFKATDKNGINAEVTGIVFDSSGKEITTFKTDHEGMGVFGFIVEDKKYTTKIFYENKEYTMNLPDVIPSGYSLQVNNYHSAALIIQVEKSPDMPTEKLGISFMCRGKVYVFNVFEINDAGRFVMRIDKNKLQAGVNQVTVFDQSGKVYAERTVFIKNNPDNEITVKMEKLKTDPEPFKPVELVLDITNAMGDPVETVFSLSVRDLDSEIPVYYADNIMVNMLMSSDLKGYIHNPAYYFEDNGTDRQYALDLLMMVQGWKRYSWKAMAGIDSFDVKYGIEPGLLIEGSVTSLVRKKPQPNIEVSMWMMNAEGGNSQQGKCVTDEEGKFNFALEELYGKWNLSLITQERNKKGNLKTKDTNIVLDRNISPTPEYYSFYENSVPVAHDNKRKKEEKPEETVVPKGMLNAREPVHADETMMSYILDEVTVTEKKQVKWEDTGLLYANIVYDVPSELDKWIDNGNTRSDLFSILFDDNPYFNMATGKYKGKKTVIVIDNVLLDESAMKTIPDVEDVKSVMISEWDGLHMAFLNREEDFKRYPPGEDYVVIFVYTKDDIVFNRNSPRGIRNTTYTGYSYPKEFYNPKYDYTVLPDQKDYRRTLYWNPQVKTGKNGRADVRFYNNGTCTNLSVSAEGLTKNGEYILFNRAD